MAMKVALIGNMNNNHFSLMRYLRDMGVDAHLLMYRNEFAHFLPECDTWRIESWRPYIRQLSFRNGKPDIFFRKRKDVLREIEGFDFYIGNGMAPALFRYVGKVLDVCIPYSEGVEFIIDAKFNWGAVFKSGRRIVQAAAYQAYRQILKSSQISGLRHNVRQVITSNLNAYNLGTYRRYRLPMPRALCVPMVYLEEPVGEAAFGEGLERLVGRLKASSLVVLSHCSHIWKDLPFYQVGVAVGKRNHWLIQGFAEYVRASGDRDAVLALFEYGPDVGNSKQLAASLGVEARLVWFPVMTRREIMSLIPLADVGGSEFSGQMWGASGCEFLACGVPMIHMLDHPEEYEARGIPLPPFYNVRSPADIAQVLLSNDRKSFAAMGVRSKLHFEAHNGYALARKYKEMLAGMGLESPVEA